MPLDRRAMPDTPEPRARRRAVGSFFVAALLSCACSANPPAVDAPRAREALKIALDGWQNGATPESLRDGSPPVVAQDLDWLAGAKLVAYRVSGEGREADANLHVPVDLTIRTPAGKDVKKAVSYVVGTSPGLTVFRELR